MAAEGPLPRSEVAVKLGSLFNLESFKGTLKAALQYQLPNLVAFKTETLVKYSSANMSVVFELAKATLDCLRMVLDLPQRLACMSYLTYLFHLMKSFFSGKTEKCATRGAFAHLTQLTSAMYLPVPPTLVLMKLGVPSLSTHTLLFRATLSETDSMPGVEKKRDFWLERLSASEPRPFCSHPGCRMVFRNLSRLRKHLEKFPGHNCHSDLELTWDVDNREVVDCAVRHLDPSQKEFIELVLKGHHVINVAKAGYGKSETLICLGEVLKILLGELGYRQFVGMCAPNNVQASVLGGSTFNSFFSIGIGETESTGDDYLATFSRSGKPALLKDLKIFAMDECFKQPQIQTDFLVKALLHGLPMGTENPFVVSKPSFPILCLYLINFTYFFFF